MEDPHREDTIYEYWIIQDAALHYYRDVDSASRVPFWIRNAHANLKVHRACLFGHARCAREYEGASHVPFWAGEPKSGPDGAKRSRICTKLRQDGSKFGEDAINLANAAPNQTGAAPS